MIKKGVYFAKFRKFAAAVLIIAAASLVLTGCGKTSTAEKSGTESSSRSSSESSSSSASASESANVFQTGYGKFELPDGWVKNDEHSTDEKPFFVSEDYDGSGVPDNISVEYGTNHYKKEQASTFGRTILRQLSSQVGGQLDGNITSSGSTTKAGDPVLKFNIPLSDRVCRQYYIVGDSCYVMVYETNFDDSASCRKAAKKIVNTFEWKQS
jgi:hypothetical protein